MRNEKNEIFIRDRADPFITKGSDGYYYFTASYPMYGKDDPEGYDRIILRRSKTIEGLKTAEKKRYGTKRTALPRTVLYGHLKFTKSAAGGTYFLPQAAAATTFGT